MSTSDIGSTRQRQDSCSQAVKEQETSLACALVLSTRSTGKKHLMLMQLMQTAESTNQMNVNPIRTAKHHELLMSVTKFHLFWMLNFPNLCKENEWTYELSYNCLHSNKNCTVTYEVSGLSLELRVYIFVISQKMMERIYLHVCTGRKMRSVRFPKISINFSLSRVFEKMCMDECCWSSPHPALYHLIPDEATCWHQFFTCITCLISIKSWGPPPRP